MVGDTVSDRGCMKLERKGQDADDGIKVIELDGSVDGEMVGDIVNGSDITKLEKKG